MKEILAIMATGMVLGYLLRSRTALFQLVDKIVMAVIFLLLFVLGISVGTNETVISNIHLIGMKALGLTVGAVAGSILCCAFVWKVFFSERLSLLSEEVSHEG